MKRAVLLDINDVLLIESDDSMRELNLTLLRQLQVLKLTDIYLFTTIGLKDIHDLSGNFKITQKELIDMLVKEGFNVHSVITPADPKLDKGPGAAYNSLYLPAYEKSLLRKDYHEEIVTFNEYANKLVGQEQYNSQTLERDRKKAMFHYFLEHKPVDLKSIIYIDSNSDCINAIQEMQHSKRPSLSVFCKDPKELAPIRHYYQYPPRRTSVWESNKFSQFLLEQYLVIRQEELSATMSQYNSLWASFFSSGRNANLKISAATKCIALLKGESPSFSAEEIEALENGRLKDLIHKNENLYEALELLSCNLSKLHNITLPKNADLSKGLVSVVIVIKEKRFDKSDDDSDEEMDNALFEELKDAIEKIDNNIKFTGEKPQYSSSITVLIPFAEAQKILAKLNPYNPDCPFISSFCVEDFIEHNDLELSNSSEPTTSNRL
jgi:hypothetical protein